MVDKPEKSMKVILVDIEGTTSSLSYIKEVMFPYSKGKLRNFLMEHAEEEKIKTLLEKLKEKFGRDISLEEAIRIFEEWIDKDIKEPILKELQGHIWEEGFISGELKGHIYQDAYKKLREWKEKGYKLYVYSSGSVKAQKLFFGHTDYGDLTGIFDGFFDASIGSKRDKESYLRIAREVGTDPIHFLFISDVEEELDAAKLAGMKTVKIERYGESKTSKHPVVKSFFEIDLP